MRVNGVVATILPPYQLVGEASLLENLQSPGGELHPKSRATVVAAPGTTYVTWPQKAFYELQQEEDSDFACAMIPAEPHRTGPRYNCLTMSAPVRARSSALRYAIQLMIARQLSDKLKDARISQRKAEKALEDEKAKAGRVPKPSDRLMSNSWTNRGGGAVAEVQAYRFRSERYERRIMELEKQVERSNRDFGDLRSVVVASALIASVGVFGVADNIKWGEEITLGSNVMGLFGNSGIA